MNAVEIEEAVSTLADQPFDPAEFPFAFLRAFGNKEIKRAFARAVAGLAFNAARAFATSPGGLTAIWMLFV